MFTINKFPVLLIGAFLTLNVFATEDTKLVRPDSENLKKWQSLKYGMFIHYGMSTFTGNEHQKTKVDPALYAPTQLDVDQWVRVARDSGMKYVVLTAKHTAGHCLWDSKVQWQGKEFDYDVSQGTDKTDVIGAFVKACVKYKIRPALYYCFEDYVNNSNYHGNGPGRAAFNMPSDYNQLVKDHLKELMTLYPEVTYLWLDIPVQASTAQRTEIYSMIKEINKESIVLYNWGWGKGAESLEKSARKTWPRDIINTELYPLKVGQFKSRQTYQGTIYEVGYEHCDKIGTGWFWSPKEKPRALSELATLYKQVKEAGGNLLLNVPPDRSGRITEASIKTLQELKHVIE